MEKIKKYKRYLALTIMPATICFMELVFRISTSGMNFGMHFLYMILFSVSYGIGIEFFLSLIPSERIYHIVKGAMLFLVAVPYLIVYFSYCEFHVFYDLNTTFGGARDAVDDFSGDVIKLVFSPNGIIHIILYMLPFVIYIIWLRKKDSVNKCRIMIKFAYFGMGVLAYLISVFAIARNKVDWKIYGKQYNFEYSIIDFGTLTGIRLEVKHKLSGDEEKLAFVMDTTDISTEEATTEAVKNTQIATEAAALLNATDTDATDTDAADTDTAGTEEAEVVEIPSGPNALDIDFSALKENASGELAALDTYVESLTPTNKNKYTGMFKGKNLILITAEAFTAEAIDEKLTPTLYRMANKGIQFTDYYQPASAGTTGGEYGVIMGMLPTSGGASMKETEGHYNYMTMGHLLNELGYYGKAYHNNSYTYYDRDRTHVNLGYSDGYMGYGNGMEEFVSDQWPESDLEMFMGTLPTYIDKQPFNTYYMTVSGHSLYDVYSNAMSKKHWDKVKDLKCSDTVKAYYACQIELDEAMEYVLCQLEKKGILKDTVICISADHFPYGLDNGSGDTSLPYLSELYGCEISNYLVRDHNRLIIWSGCLEEQEPIIVDEPTFSPDITPTLCNLFGIDYDSRLLIGRDALSDAMPLVFDLGYDWKTDLGTYIASTGTFIPKDESVKLPENYVDTIETIISNKINYSKGVLAYDYYRHVFNPKE